MLAFNGFPNVLWSQNELEMKFSINIVKDYKIIYEKEDLSNKIDSVELFKIISEINALINMYKDDEQINVINFIEFMIWFDENHKYQNEFIKQFIVGMFGFSEKINIIEFFVKHPEYVEKYKLNYLIDSFWNIDIRKYINANFFILMNNFCDKYNFDYKEKIFSMLKTVLSEKTIQIIKDNFDDIYPEDLESIVYFATNQNNVQETDYKHMCLLVYIIDSIMEKQ
jgi:hypothetical protein